MNVKQKKNYVECFGIGASGCSNIFYEQISIHNIDGNAFRHGGSFGNYPGIPYDTTKFINCDAFNCCDSLPRTASGNPALGGAADGYKTWNKPGSVFIFEGCRAFKCSDDGFDPGTDPLVIINNCWSFRNGYLDGDGCGFKTGGMIYAESENIITRVVTNNIATENSGSGFFLLEYPSYYRTNARFYNNVAYKNGHQGFNFSRNEVHPKVLGVWKNNISYKNIGLVFDNAYQMYTESNNTWDRVDGFPGFISSTDFTVGDDDFVSLIPKDLSAPRKLDGSLPDIDFLKLVSGSDLIGAGTFVGMSEKPDVGIDWNYLKRK